MQLAVAVTAELMLIHVWGIWDRRDSRPHQPQVKGGSHGR